MLAKQQQPTPPPPPPLCALCQTPTRIRCSRCKVVYYCSLDCQGKHWKGGHQVECRRLIASQNLSARKAAAAAAAAVEKEALCASDGSLTKPKKVLYPYDYFVRFFNSDALSIPCGLINCGNSCYANVILQCLSYTRPLAAYLLRKMHKSQCQRNDWCFMCELEDHMLKAYENPGPFSPIKILSRLRNIGNNLGYGRQEDAHEFMRYAVDTMQKICLDEAGGESRTDARTQETTLIQHIFGGHLQSQVTCSRCFQQSNRYDNMLDLSVEIHGAVETLEDALRQFTAAEWLDGENKYACDRCDAYVPARKRLAIHEAPNILTIALKRFQGGKFGKINKKVAFPEVLNILPYMTGKGDVPPPYHLYALVVHVDMLNASYFGHYVCFVKDKQGTWFKVDDNKVKEVDTERVMSQKAYMLFYMRSVVRPGPIVEEWTPTSSTTSTSDSGAMQTSSSVDAGGSFGLDGEISSESPVLEEDFASAAAVTSHPNIKNANTSNKRNTNNANNSSKIAKSNRMESSDSSIDSGLPMRVAKRRHQLVEAEIMSPCSCNNQSCTSSHQRQQEKQQQQQQQQRRPQDEGPLVLTGTGDDDVEGSLLQSTLTSLAGECSNVVVSSTPAAEQQAITTTTTKRPRTSESGEEDETSPSPEQQHQLLVPSFLSSKPALQPMLKRGFLNNKNKQVS